MGILAWIVVGLLAGWLAEQFVRGTGHGLLEATVLGVLGAIVGGFVASTFLRVPDPVSGVNLPTLLTAFLGSIALLVVIRVVNGRRI
jgi:uncharacterized membrane protein YeaQ/YmgE (transglycosylase-associated protein family)